MQKSPAILVIFFNRPDVLCRQLLALKQFMPSSVYFAADGPRFSNEDDLHKLNLCKKMIATEIDWACNLHFNYSEKNSGCDQFVPMAIDWFFSNVDAGIVLEDDCLISKEFYTFSSSLLDRYAADDRVMNISASNFQLKKWGDADYYFSRYPANWAWATWRRAWQHFDSSMRDLNEFTAPDGEFIRIELTPQEKRYWLKFFHGLQKGRYTFWDAKWLYSIWKRNGVSITPNFNLSTNIGFGEAATHTKERTQTHALSIHPLGSALKHPSSLEIQADADHYLYLNFYKPSLSGLFKSAISKMKKVFQ